MSASLGVHVHVGVSMDVSVRVSVSVNLSVSVGVSVDVNAGLDANVGVDVAVEYAKLEKISQRAAVRQPYDSHTAAARQLKRLQSALKLKERNPTLIASGK